MIYYLVTNRKVSADSSGKEIIDTSSDGVASTGIRFATFDSSQAGYDAYTVLPDTVDAPHAFFSKLYNDMSSPQGGDVLFFIHGFECDWSCSIDNLRDMEKQHVDPPGSNVKHIVGFSWPSKGSLLHYPADDAVAAASGSALGTCFQMLIDFFNKQFQPQSPVLQPCNRKIHLLSHSMGNLVLQNMMAIVTRVGNQYYSVFEEILMLAADVDNDAFDQGTPLSIYGLNNICRRVTIYTNRMDKALSISGTIKHRMKRLGTDGPDNLNTLPSHIYVVDCTDVCGQIAGFFPNIKDEVIHHWYFKTVPKVTSDITAVLSGANAESILNRGVSIPGVKFRIQP